MQLLMGNIMCHYQSEYNTDRRASAANRVHFATFPGNGMSVAFSPLQVGPMTLKNRFIRSATWEFSTGRDGVPKPHVFKLMNNLAKGNVGLIVSGFTSCTEGGKLISTQNVLHTPELAEMWRPAIDSCHKHGSKFMFQLMDGGILAARRKTPSVTPLTGLFKWKSMTESEIEEVIDDFGKAALNAYKAGADGVQLHAGHGFLLSLFLSPLTNRRKDKWGGSEENRVRIVAEVAESIRRQTDPGFSVAVKINGDDMWSSGVKQEMCAKSVNMLKGKIDFFEISCGLGIGATRSKPRNPGLWHKLKSKLFSQEGAYRDMYNLETAAFVKKMNPWAVVSTVGGVRSIDMANAALKSVDLVGMSRPFIREPRLLCDWEAGKTSESRCISCNKCSLNGRLWKIPLQCTYP